MYVDKIKETFERNGYHADALISYDRFQNVISSLMVYPSIIKRGQPFDREVGDELWEQASGGSNMISIQRICETISDGISILIVKI